MKITENHLLVLTQTHSNKLKNSNKLTYKNFDIRLIPYIFEKQPDREIFNKMFDILTMGNL